MKKHRFVLLTLLTVLFSFSIVAQDVLPARHKIAIFAPIYLDSVFNGGTSYRYGSSFPRFVNPGLEFYLGAQLALDSLQKIGVPLEVYVYDSRAQYTTLTQQLARPELANVEMIIAQATAPEVRTLADAALQKKIPFISATLPNDAGISNNPYYVIINSTLRTHAEGIHQYVQKYHARDNIIVFRKNGLQENQIKEFLEETNKTAVTTPLRFQFEDIGSDFDISQLTRRLDSTRRNICIAGSLDAAFGTRLATQLASIATDYPITLIGMPTWEELNLSKSEYRNLEIVYTTPFNYSRPTSIGNRITSQFLDITNGRPSDIFYRGYETTLRFALLLVDTKKDVASNLSRKGNFIFTNFDIQPVFLNKQTMTLDYFENKKLYYVRINSGVKTVL